MDDSESVLDVQSFNADQEVYAGASVKLADFDKGLLIADGSKDMRFG